MSSTPSRSSGSAAARWSPPRYKLRLNQSQFDLIAEELKEILSKITLLCIYFIHIYSKTYESQNKEVAYNPRTRAYNCKKVPMTL